MIQELKNRGLGSPSRAPITFLLTALISFNVASAANSGLDNVTGTGLDNVTGTGLDNVTGTGLDNVTGTGLDNVTGTGLDNVTGTGLDNVTGTGLDNFSATEPNGILLGPVSTIDSSAGTVGILGQTVQLLQNTRFGESSANELSVGNLVEVSGLVIDKGKVIATEVRLVAKVYVPGANQVYVSGLVESIDTRTGKISVGGLEVDYTSLLGSQSLDSVQPGDYVQISGTQPSYDGSLLSTNITR